MRFDTSDLEEAATAVKAREGDPEPSAFAVSVIAGPEAGQRAIVDGSLPGPFLVGSSPVCALRLSDRMVSRRHAAFDLDGNRLRVTDLGSTNGTFVNQLAVVDAFLKGGEQVSIGESVIRVTREKAAALDTSASDHPERFGRLIGRSPEMRRLYPLIERLAGSNLSLVIEGETGTGKEVLAEAIHDASPRSAGPFVVFDCTTVATSLIEAELFGHERGAFTGAVSSRKGVFEQAQGGTLLIDEIGDLDRELQPKLLRALERGEIRRVGGDRTIRVDVRVIAATRRDLDLAVQQDRFRDDLFHRLAVGRVELPPLRRRHGDVRLLAEHFWRELGGTEPLAADVLRRWDEHTWPGNVRELRNAVARYLTLGDEGVALSSPTSTDAARGHDFMAEVLARRLPLPVARLRVVEEFEKRYIEQTLAEHGGDVARAAQASGLARRYFTLLRSGKRRR